MSTTVTERERLDARETLDRLERELTGESRSAQDIGGHAVVQARGLSRTYGKGDAAVRALGGVDIDIRQGRLTAIMGPSGSGKSTLMHILAGLDQPSGGRVWIDGTEITRLKEKRLTQLRRDKIGFIFQSFNLLATLTADENIVLPLSLARRRADEAWRRTVIETIGLQDRLTHRPAELSGGQQQRVAVARALITRPAVLFADEPTGNLDSRTGGEVLELLRRSVDEFGQTVIMVTHDAGAASIADRVVFLKDGGIVQDRERMTRDAIYETIKHLETPGAATARVTVPFVGAVTGGTER
jgi:putative ABC transport system ATP-binding protein